MGKIFLHKINTLKSYLTKTRENRRIAEAAVKEADVCVIHAPGEYDVIKYARKYNKPYLVVVCGCPWDSLWNYDWRGKLMAPLAYMRGRTLDNAYIILDEAHNTTPAQMKMFLTRIGFGSKVVVTGDETQKDLSPGSTSGLSDALKILSDIDDIGVCRLTSKDVVRHPLVQKIVKAYEINDEKLKRKSNANKQRQKRKF